MEDPESDALQYMILGQQSHEIFCPDCENCITHHLALQKRKRAFDEPSSSKYAEFSGSEDSEEFSDDPDDVLPQVLLEQDTHDLFCPVCEYSITDKVILENKRKRESDSEVRGSFVDAVEWDEFYMRSVLQRQSTFDLCCPDCEACITHEVILQKGKRVAFASDAAAEGTPWPHETGRFGPGDIAASQQQREPQMERDDEIAEEFEHSQQDDPPSKRQRKSVQAAAADQEEKDLIQIFQEQTTHDLTCPDCNSLITYEVILRKKVRRFKAKTSESEDVPIALQREDKKGRKPRKIVNYVDRNPWKTRYKSYYGSGISATADERKDPGSRVAKYGAVTNRTLTEPLLSDPNAAALRPMTFVERYNDARETFRETWQTNLIYFATFFFLWCVWLLLRYI